MPRPILRRSMLVLAAGVLAFLPLRAEVIFSNLGGAPTGVSALLVGGISEVDQAQAFTPSADFSMTDAQLVIESPGQGVNLFLYSDNSGQPGSSIEQLATGLSGPSSNYALETVNSFAPIHLTTGTQYWLVLTPANASNTGVTAWGDNGTSFVPRATSTTGGASWTVLEFDSQFQIDGTPLTTTPEPSAISLFCCGGVCLLVIARRARARSRA